MGALDIFNNPNQNTEENNNSEKLSFDKKIQKINNIKTYLDPSLDSDIFDNISKINSLKEKYKNNRIGRDYNKNQINNLIVEVEKSLGEKIKFIINSNGKISSDNKKSSVITNQEKNNSPTYEYSYGSNGVALINDNHTNIKNSDVKKDVFDENGVGYQKKYGFYLSYFELKGLDKNNSLYNIIKTNFDYLSKNPVLVYSYDIKLVWQDKEYTYPEFLKKFVDNNVKLFVNGNNPTNIPKGDKVYKSIINKTSDDVNDLQKAIYRLDIEGNGTFYDDSIFDGMDRAVISDILNKQNQELISDNFLLGYTSLEYIKVDDISTRLDQFILNSNGKGLEVGTLAHYIKENKNSIIKNLKKSEEVFNSLKKDLNNIRLFLSENKDNLSNQQINSISNQIRGITGLMIFINSLHNLELTDLIFSVKNLSIPFQVFDNLLSEEHQWWPIIGFSILMGGISFKYGTKFKNRISLNKLLPSNSSSDPDKKNNIKYTDKFKGYKLDQLLEEMSNKDGILKEKYLGFESIHDNLKKLISIKKAYNIKFDDSSIFLSKKAFSRDILTKVFEGNPGKIRGLINILFDLKGFKGWLDTIGAKPNIFKNPFSFNGGKHSKYKKASLFSSSEDLLDNLLEFDGKIGEIGNNLEYLEFKQGLTYENRKKLIDILPRIQDSLLSPNMNIAKSIAGKFGISDDKTIRELYEIINKNPTFLKSKIKKIVYSANGVENSSILKDIYNIVHKKLLRKNNLTALEKELNQKTKELIKKGFEDGIKDFDNQIKLFYSESGDLSSKNIKQAFVDKLNSYLNLTGINKITIYDITDDKISQYQQKKDFINSFDKNALNKHLLSIPEKIRFNHISNLDTDEKVQKITKVIEDINKVLEQKQSLPKNLQSAIDEVLKSNFDNIQSSINSRSPIIPDGRISELIGTGGEKGEIAMIKESFEAIQKLNLPNDELQKLNDIYLKGIKKGGNDDYIKTFYSTVKDNPSSLSNFISSIYDKLSNIDNINKKTAVDLVERLKYEIEISGHNGKKPSFGSIQKSILNGNYDVSNIEEFEQKLLQYLKKDFDINISSIRSMSEIVLNLKQKTPILDPEIKPIIDVIDKGGSLDSNQSRTFYNYVKESFKRGKI